MNRLLSTVIDRYALYDLHRKKSIVSQFITNHTQAYPSKGEHKKFYNQPNLPNVEMNEADSGFFKFKSEINNGKSNQFATVEFYLNNPKAGKNVVLVHGWRQGNQRIKDIYLNALTSKGYNIYLFTLPHHRNRQENLSSYNGEFFISANVERTITSMQQAVSDLRALILWLKSQSTAKVIVIGISLGGLIASLTATAEKSMDGMITVFSPNSLSYATWYSIPGKKIRQDLEQNGYIYDKLKIDWELFDTSNFELAIPKEKVLLFSALYDKYIDLQDATKLWEKWNRPQRLLYRCGHTGLVFCKQNIARDTIAYIENL
ncbi:alpha/beta fold hydrolase|uniref:Alpha/beta hydrolase family protein n=1 Tax=Dendrosporobacter quercicolus TaxID=146817 RepID=A0A1G9UPI5_9FIRM|nr:alpha/beta fold hydrolase [Dendrosporobacter quercicolus]NSL48070.1 alpha/beta fold hydrolase [Dendrosporobacter quercicolus DSM 1736]SDM61872.1 Alpha/beta hydrolase family protein [Dendrosporobacter quercicolus]